MRFVSYLFDSWTESIRSAIRASNTYRELNSLTDRELQDLGITRSQIPTVVYDSVTKRVQLPSKSF